MSWIDFLPDNVRKHPENFVGPNIAGTMVQCLETGILINQSIRFWSRAQSEPTVIKFLVSFVLCAAALQTAIALYNTWRVAVEGFGDAAVAVNLRWPDRIQPALNCVMAAPFQAYLIWRCWSVLHKRWIILIPLATLLLASVVINVYITVDIFSISSISSLLNGPPRSYITAFVISAVLDMMITALMIWFLLQAKSRVVSHHLAKALVRLHRMVWEAAIPPCTCAIAACAVYITMSSRNLWDVFLQSILGKLYVISLFVVLNGRVDLKRTLHVTTRSSRMSRYWASDGAGFQFRPNGALDSDVELTPTTVDTPLQPGRDALEQKASLSPREDNLSTPNGLGVSAAAGSARGSIFLDLGETNSFVMVARPPTVLHRSVGATGRRLSF